MRLVPLAPAGYAAWDAFCAASPDAWFWHTSHWLEYQLAWADTLGSRSRAFVVEEDGQVLAAVPLMVVEHRGAPFPLTEVSLSSEPCWAPALAAGLPERRRHEVLRRVFGAIDETAAREGAVRATFKVSALTVRERPAPPALRRFGYADISLDSQIMDLTGSEAELWQAIPEPRRRHIARGQRHLTTTVHDGVSVTRAVFDEYRDLHARAAGRVTRPPATFALMYRWILDGHAVLVRTGLDAAAVGFVYVFLYKDAGFYGSGANDPDRRDLPIGHVLHWEAIRWLRARGRRAYELGVQRYGPLPHDVPTDKELGIATFKRRFGGRPVPLYVWEKYYAADVYKQVAAERTARYAERLRQRERLQ